MVIRTKTFMRPNMADTDEMSERNELDGPGPLDDTEMNIPQTLREIADDIQACGQGEIEEVAVIVRTRHGVVQIHAAGQDASNTTLYLLLGRAQRLVEDFENDEAGGVGHA